jgi:alkyl hydroperoxide reductase subunit AhpC
MKSADEYLKAVRRVLGIPVDQSEIHLQWEYDTPEDIKIHLAQIRQIQKELRFLKREISLDVKAIRADYRLNVSNVQAGLLSSLAGRKFAGHDRALKKESLRQKEREVIFPYESLSRQIDQLIIQLDGAKMQMEHGIVNSHEKG